MTQRPVVPKDLSRYPDFPVRLNLNQDDYNQLIIEYWIKKKKEKRKLAQKHYKLKKKVRNYYELHLKTGFLLADCEEELKKLAL